MTENEMVGWHHRLDGHEFEQALEVGNGQGGLECCSPWGCRVGQDSATEQFPLNMLSQDNFNMLEEKLPIDLGDVFLLRLLGMIDTEFYIYIYIYADIYMLLLLLLSHVSRVRFCAIP